MTNKNYSIFETRPPNILVENKNPLVTTDRFKLVFARSPNTSYFCQNFTLPSIVNGETTVSRPLVDAHFPGPKTTYDPLTVSMLVSEDLANYIEIFKWIVAGDLTDDISVIILNSKNIGISKVTFKNAFPTSLGSVSFNVQDSDVVYGQVDINFRYDYFTFE